MSAYDVPVGVFLLVLAGLMVAWFAVAVVAACIVGAATRVRDAQRPVRSAAGTPLYDHLAAETKAAQDAAELDALNATWKLS